MRIIFYSFVGLMCISCNGKKFDNLVLFTEVMDKGYSAEYPQNSSSGEKLFAKSIYPNYGKSNFCVYGSKPHDQAKITITSFYKLLRIEFGESDFLVFKDSLIKCPTETTVYVKLHEGDVLHDEFGKDNMYIANKHSFKYIKSYSNKVGFAWFRRSGKKKVSFVAVNLLSKYQLNPIYKKITQAALIQELFQVTLSGRDITSKKKLSSILHESLKVWDVQSLTEASLKGHLEQNPNGMCGIDLWYIILLNDYFEKNWYKFDNYPNKFSHYSSKIIKRALEIENNPAYNHLFDPRCSGKNTGINTKIGIQ